MAPVTHSSRSAPSALPREGSWQVPDEQDFEQDEEEELEEVEDEDSEAQSGDDPFMDKQGPKNVFGTSTAQQLLEPLQRTADRVSRQVEEFAKCLDRFNASRHPNEQAIWDEAGNLLDKYYEHATTRAKQAASSRPSSRSSSRNRNAAEENDKEAQKAQLEADLWALLGQLLDCNSPRALAETEESQKTVLDGLHRYSSDLDVWMAFTKCDTFGQECYEILHWLQENAANSTPTIEDAVAPLAEKAQRGDGIWSAGWLYTKMAIKAQKRSRSWPKPLEPTIPGLELSHRRSDDSSALVTQMDPDASQREGNGLQPQDDYHEQAAWQMCWELLRRGFTLNQCREWWTERKETWRAAALRGSVDDENEDLRNSPWYRIVGLNSEAEWFEMCKYLAQNNTGIDKFQSAVYGLLCGDLQSSTKVCNTLEDHLFVRFNAFIIQRYQHFVNAFRQRRGQPETTSFTPQSPGWEYIQRYVVFAEDDNATTEEFRNPSRLAEAAIVSKNYESFFLRQGIALAQIAATRKSAFRGHAGDFPLPIDEHAQIAARDPDFLRMTAHLQLLLRSLGFLDHAYNTNPVAMEYNIVGYIEWLQEQSEFALIPLYASNLSDDRAADVLGTVMMNINNAEERDFHIGLMRQYKLNVPDALWEQFRQASEIVVRRGDNIKQITPVLITEYVGTAKVKLIKVRSHFMDDELDEDTDQAIRSIEWYCYTDRADWGRACEAASTLFKTFFMQGKLAAAKDLTTRASLEEISKAALGIDLSGDSPQPVDDEDLEMDRVADDQPPDAISPSKRGRGPKNSNAAIPMGTTPEALHAQATTWRELEQLITVLDLLEAWTEIADNVDQHRTVSPSSETVRALKRRLSITLHSIIAAMSSLLNPHYLTQPTTPSESPILAQIRRHYLPEALLAYTSVLYFAGHAISRTWLVQTLELAQLVATNPTLTAALVEGKRMGELVTQFALGSQGLLKANEMGRKARGKGRGSAKRSASGGSSGTGSGAGEDGMDIWQVKFDDCGVNGDGGDIA